MHKIERHKKIMDIVNEDKFVTINTLKDKMPGIADITLYRDIKALESQDLITSIRGAITVPHHEGCDQVTSSLLDHEELDLKNVNVLNKINNIIWDNATLFVGVSERLSYLPNFISKRNVWIVSNSFSVLEKCILTTNVNVNSTGGYLHKKRKCFVGSDTLKRVKNDNYDICVLEGNIVDGVVYLDSISLSEIYEVVLQNSMIKIVINNDNLVLKKPFAKIEEFNFIV